MTSVSFTYLNLYDTYRNSDTIYIRYTYFYLVNSLFKKLSNKLVGTTSIVYNQLPAAHLLCTVPNGYSGFFILSIVQYSKEHNIFEIGSVSILR
jgi:hypothetical protein